MEANSVRFAPGGPGIEPRWTRGTKVVRRYCLFGNVSNYKTG
jgi:hypothetical protein